MLRGAIAAAVGWMIVAGVGCRENEETFFIENVKAQPQAPQCTTSAGDPMASEGILDLAFRNAYGSYVSVRNQLMSRESLENLHTESAGIFVDGAEVYVQGLDGLLIGGTEYYEYGTYIEPESADIAYATLVSKAVVAQMAASKTYSCPALNGNSFNPVNREFDPVYAVVRILGHTGSEIDVETPEFSFLISICCGCLVNWDPCYESCSRYCDTPEDSDMCIPGVGPSETGYDCRRVFHDLNATWPSSPTLECTADDGSLRDCNCGDCKAPT